MREIKAMNILPINAVILTVASVVSTPLYAQNSLDDVAGSSSTTAAVTTAGTTSSSSSSVNKNVFANFSDKLFVIPCVEVKSSVFDGYYHVVMSKSVDDSGLHWQVKEAKPASAAACNHSADDDASTDDRLTRLGLPNVSELNHR